MPMFDFCLLRHVIVGHNIQAMASPQMLQIIAIWTLLCRSVRCERNAKLPTEVVYL